MGGDRYFIRDQQSCYFFTFTIVQHIDVFSRKEYRDIVVDSLNHCVENKGVEIYAWVIMSNHVHLVTRCSEPYSISNFLRDCKKHTSKEIIKSIQSIHESRRDWLLDKFAFEAKRTRRAEQYKVWKDDNHPIDLESYNIPIMEKIDYIHNNPVKAGIVRHPDEYIYSSAIDYSRKAKGLVNVTVV